MTAARYFGQRKALKVYSASFSFARFYIFVPTFSGLLCVRSVKFYYRIENRVFRLQIIHNFWPFAHFLPTFKIKSGHDF